MSLQLQHLREKIATAETLFGVVETMHGLAAVNIRRAEAAASESARYARTVHLALHAALLRMQRDRRRGVRGEKSVGSPSSIARPGGAGAAAGVPTLLVISTDMGLCGQFNERIVRYALKLENRLLERSDLGAKTSGGSDGSPANAGDTRESPIRRSSHSARARWIVVGLRGLERLEEAGASIVARMDAPGSVEAIPNTVSEAFSMLNDHLTASKGAPLYIVHNRPDGGASFTGRHVQLFPFEPERWRRLPEGEPPWSAEPMTSPSAAQLLPRLIREQVYIDVFQAFIESFAAENAARLASMKNATDNIDELLDELQARYRRERQDAITTELMELLGGVQAVLSAD